MRRLKAALAVGMATGLVGLGTALTSPGFLVEEHLGLEWLFSIRGPVEPPDDAVIVSVDKASSDWIRSLPEDPSLWPQPLRECFPDPSTIDRLRSARDITTWPRQLHGCLVDALAGREVSVIAFDILFAEGREQGEDEALAAAIQRAGRVVLMQSIDRVRPASPGNVSATDRSQSFDVLVSPVDVLRDRAMAVGPFPLPRVQSKVLQFWTFKDSVGGVPTLPVVAMQVHVLPALKWFFASGTGDSGDDLIGTSRPGETRSAERLGFLVDNFLTEIRDKPGILEDRLARQSAGNDRLPLDRYRRELENLARVHEGRRYHYVNYYGPPRAIRTFSLHELFSSRDSTGSDELDLGGKAVFVGRSEFSSEDQADGHPTVFSGEFAVDSSGVEIAATTFLNVLHGQTLRPLSNLERAFAVFTFGFLVAGLACLLPGARGISLALGFGGLYLFAAGVLFGRYGLWLPLVVPLILQLPVAVLAGLLRQYFGALHWFEIFVPRELVTRLMSGDETLATSTSERDATIMFTDIAGYSGLSEEHGSSKMSAFLNRHYGVIQHPLEDEGGVIGQYSGDGLLAFWGAFERQEDHAVHACRAALAIAAAVHEDNERRRNAGEPPYRLRIGIDSGKVTAGPVGSQTRADFTVTGDHVNVASRLEQLCKTVCPDNPEVSILISGATASAIRPHFAITSIGSHILRGRTKETDVYRLVIPPDGSAVADSPDYGVPRASAPMGGSNR